VTKRPANKEIPALLVDIDGVISLFGFPHGGSPAGPGAARPPGTWVTVDGIVHFLSEQAGRHLLVLAEHFELVWCSGWEEKANEYLPRALGIPGPLPYLTFGPDHAPPSASRAPTAGDQSLPDGGVRRHWKLDAIDAWAGQDRPLAWLDDAFDDSSHLWAASRPGPTLLVATEPATGLTDRERDALLGWVGVATG
jgi:hypothetical protein